MHACVRVYSVVAVSVEWRQYCGKQFPQGDDKAIKHSFQFLLGLFS